MLLLQRSSDVRILTCLSLYLLGAFQIPWSTSVVVPKSTCYAFDNTSRIVDFTEWIGHHFEYDGKDSPDLVVRFCKDVEARSQQGYVDFGRYATFNYFVAGSGNVNFVQGFYKGDLSNCETTYDKLGRTAQVNIICGKCLNENCKGELGCICRVKYDSTRCRVLIELAIPCEKPGPRVFEGFTVGFNPHSWEIVSNGITQLGYEKSHPEFSFGTLQTHLSLYMTARASLSGLVGKPSVKVNPDNGLDVHLSGSGAHGNSPTTLSPTIIVVNWICEKARNSPYEVTFSIPVEGYEPIEFILTKKCEYRQEKEGDSDSGWATFGMFSCIFMVLSTAFCCGGFFYKIRVEHQRGLDALPGMTILSACLETVSSRGDGYPQAENSPFVSQTSWDHIPVSAQTKQRTSESTYGSI
ncbi:hypothetical protein H6P81_009726 [Aristolochia fimbriata]|uniref:AT4G36440-like protein n=1 Tax=Aristolochia fimbriata TaxID=158543 RepID=A0AAV7EPY9_ARIFI|nr:hypothetical protein H6P81_009726 [Aristolochia fimbriata]